MKELSPLHPKAHAQREVTCLKAVAALTKYYINKIQWEKLKLGKQSQINLYVQIPISDYSYLMGREHI